MAACATVELEERLRGLLDFGPGGPAGSSFGLAPAWCVVAVALVCGFSSVSRGTNPNNGRPISPPLGRHLRRGPDPDTGPSKAYVFEGPDS